MNNWVWQSIRWVWLGAMALLIAFLPVQKALAHAGVPYIVLPEQDVGPYRVTVWSDPDVGTGTFIVEMYVDGAAAPADTTLAIEVWPDDLHREPQRFSIAPQQRLFGGQQYTGLVDFDTAGLWQCRLLVSGSAGEGQAEFPVEVTPPGPGWLESAICLLPFVGIGLVWLLGVRQMRKKAAQAAAEVPAPPSAIRVSSGSYV